jgi:transcriptional regulator with XRE-family HTH domain
LFLARGGKMIKEQDIKSTVLENISTLAGEKRYGRTTLFAKEVGISTKHARDILEKGVMPKIETLKKIATAYDISLDTLVLTNSKTPKVDHDLIEIIVLQKKILEIAKKDPLFKRNITEGFKLHLEMYEKGLEHEVTSIMDTMWAMTRRIYGRKKTKK